MATSLHYYIVKIFLRSNRQYFNFSGKAFADNMKFNINHDSYNVEEKHIEKDVKEDFEDDYVVKSMGAFGRWQAIVVTVVSSARLIAMWNILSMLFLMPATGFICKRINNASIIIEKSTCYDDCMEYEFDKEIFEQNFLSEFNLICNRAWMASFTQLVLMFGVVAGIAAFGWISDR